MINYGPNAKRTLFKSEKKNKLYSRIADEKGTISFVELYSSSKDYMTGLKECQDLLEKLYGLELESVSMGDLTNICKYWIVALNIDLLKLQETAEVIKVSNNDPIIKDALNKSISKLQNDINNATTTWTQFIKNNYPNAVYNYRSDLFKIPGVVKKIEDGQEEFKDIYGTLETSNHQAYQSLTIHNLLGGVDTFSVEQLTRLSHFSPTENAKLEQEYQEHITQRKQKQEQEQEQE